MKVFSLRRSKPKRKEISDEEVLSATPACSSIDPDSMHHEPVLSPSISLGIGQVSKHGIVFTPRFGFQYEEEITATASEQSDESCEEGQTCGLLFRMRAADLPSDDTEWVTIEANSPVISALYEHSEHVVFHEEMWTPDSKTAKILCGTEEDSWKLATFGPHTCRGTDTTMLCEDHDILVWSGTFENCYGSDIPAIRSAAVIAMDALALTELLMDSSRVKSYNALSLGRTDNIVWNDSIGMVTKVMTSETRVFRKTLTFTSLMHVRKTDDGSFHLVTRAAEQEGSSTDGSEILLGINRIVPLSRDTCLMINVNHIKSPLVPMMIAKRIGLQAAVNFVHDIRKVSS